MHARSFRPVYVWQAPVRLFHWINALSIVVLAVTGYLIADPPVLTSSAEASAQYWFGINRFIHFATAYVFLLNIVLRLYWAFVGNEFADWASYNVFTRRFWHGFADTLREDIFLVTKPGRPRLGHNSLARLAYIAMMLVALFQVFTGFALYAPMSGAWFPQLFLWVTPLFGDEMTVRVWHHVAMWFFALFLVIHLYLIIFHEVREFRGVFSSIVSGWKYQRTDWNK